MIADQEKIKKKKSRKVDHYSENAPIMENENNSSGPSKWWRSMANNFVSACINDKKSDIQTMLSRTAKTITVPIIEIEFWFILIVY